jgi:hypothetical protein
LQLNAKKIHKNHYAIPDNNIIEVVAHQRDISKYKQLE